MTKGRLPMKLVGRPIKTKQPRLHDTIHATHKDHPPHAETYPTPLHPKPPHTLSFANLLGGSRRRSSALSASPRVAVHAQRLGHAAPLRQPRCRGVLALAPRLGFAPTRARDGVDARAWRLGHAWRSSAPGRRGELPRASHCCACLVISFRRSRTGAPSGGAEESGGACAVACLDMSGHVRTCPDMRVSRGQVWARAL